MASGSKDKTLTAAAPSPAVSKPEIALRGAAPTNVGTEEEVADLPTDRQSQIAVAAYYKAAQRGFTGGNEIADWLAAEQEVDAHEANRSGTPVEARY